MLLILYKYYIFAQSFFSPSLLQFSRIFCMEGWRKSPWCRDEAHAPVQTGRVLTLPAASSTLNSRLAAPKLRVALPAIRTPSE